ncbi:hypothetical protein ACFSGX_08610 [Sphingomonas arantia]|uniref:Response regulatory domain-containing protein n=1 Tax=Sphingomonas arantia TaxID=1460676 RepID=A0ABW4TZ34_9SPHN
MTPPDALAGQRILVLEDDFYLAREQKLILEQAGAVVIGPFGTAVRVDELASLGAVDSAIVDINLGRGPTFEFARWLQARGVPFVFVTGYDAATIPPDLSHIDRLEKPIRATELVQALLHLTRPAADRENDVP